MLALVSVILKLIYRVYVFLHSKPWGNPTRKPGNTAQQTLKKQVQKEMFHRCVCTCFVGHLGVIVRDLRKRKYPHPLTCTAYLWHIVEKYELGAALLVVCRCDLFRCDVLFVFFFICTVCAAICKPKSASKNLQRRSRTVAAKNNVFSFGDHT